MVPSESASWYWTGAKKAKFLRMCETQPAMVRSMDLQEMDRYLIRLDKTRLERQEELWRPCLKKCGVLGDEDTWSRDPMFFRMYKTAHAMAEEMAMQEMLDA